MRAFKILKVTALICCIAFMASCEYEFIELYTPPPPDPTDTTKVLFSAEVAPIFETSSCTSCHNGGLAFDLTAPNAYNNIVNDNLVVPFKPEESIIYTFPHPQTGTHSSKYKSWDEVNILSKWISQGALNN